MKNNTQVSFYSVTHGGVEKSLIKLLEKIYSSNQRLLLKVNDEDTVELLDRLLWTYKPISFLAHGTIDSLYPEKQPILITCTDENYNNAELILLFNEAESVKLNFLKIIYFFDGHNTNINILNLERLKRHVDLFHQVKSWHQDDQGSWS